MKKGGRSNSVRNGTCSRSILCLVIPSSFIQSVDVVYPELLLQLGWTKQVAQIHQRQHGEESMCAQLVSWVFCFYNISICSNSSSSSVQPEKYKQIVNLPFLVPIKIEKSGCFDARYSIGVRLSRNSADVPHCIPLAGDPWSPAPRSNRRIIKIKHLFTISTIETLDI